MQVTNPNTTNLPSDFNHRFDVPKSNDSADGKNEKKEKEQSKDVNSSIDIDSYEHQMSAFQGEKLSHALATARQETDDFIVKSIQDRNKHTTDTIAAILNGVQDTGNKLNNAGTQIAKGINF